MIRENERNRALESGRGEIKKMILSIDFSKKKGFFFFSVALISMEVGMSMKN